MLVVTRQGLSADEIAALEARLRREGRATRRREVGGHVVFHLELPPGRATDVLAWEGVEEILPDDAVAPERYDRRSFLDHCLMAAGALTGICVVAGSVLNPADGAFSVAAWIKGGAPGQVVLSQANGVSWLCTDSIDGCLMTELMGSGRYTGGYLSSTATITDGKWYHLGFVWDGIPGGRARDAARDLDATPSFR